MAPDGPAGSSREAALLRADAAALGQTFSASLSSSSLRASLAANVTSAIGTGW
jgi:hypothetical protein